MPVVIVVTRTLEYHLTRYDPFQNVGGNLLILHKLPMAWFYC